jgi:hypothetical protein
MRISAATLCVVTTLVASAGWAEPEVLLPRGLTHVRVEKALADPFLDAHEARKLLPDLVYRPLSPRLVALLGPQAVDYEAFTAAYVPSSKVSEVLRLADEEGARVVVGADEDILFPHWRVTPGDPLRRSAPWPADGVAHQHVSGLFVIQFAYPVASSWLEELARCGIEVLAHFPARAFLVRSEEGRGAIHRCGPARYLSWLDSFLSTDRARPDLLDDRWDGAYVIQFLPGTHLAEGLAELPPGVLVLDSDESVQDRRASARVAADRRDLAQLLRTSRTVLAIGRYVPERPELSDERQGQILAGNHNGTTVSGTGYRSWLSARSLLSASNMPLVAVFDSGYDDGEGPAGLHHPDLENPERLYTTKVFAGTFMADRSGHGTLVAGIIVGDGTAGIGGGATDSQGYTLGLGIAPSARLVAIKILDQDPTTCQTSTFPTDNDTLKKEAACARAWGASVGNQSWNSPVSLGQYTESSMTLDQLVIDARPAGLSDVAGCPSPLAFNGEQSMAMVFSAGNFGFITSLNTERPNSIGPPATAKNVITVGATGGDRTTLTCSGLPYLNEGIGQVAQFSSRGRKFGPGLTPLHSTPIKPDVVAPGVHVFSTVPYQASTYSCPFACQQYYPASPLTYHTYANGTSFAAPAVTGAAALASKWFKDRYVDASPSLIKAALIATADDMVDNNDHRPSYKFGWGRVNLDRLTSARKRFFQTDDAGIDLMTGEQWSWTRTIENPADDALIVLAWSDPACNAIGTSQCNLNPLINDLDLAVEAVSTTSFWRGNNFAENKTGADTGYSHRFTSSSDPVLHDGTNNVEAIFIPRNTLAAGQKLTIRIVGANVPQGPQKWAVYAYNLNMTF